MRVFTIPNMEVELLQHDSSQAVSEDAYYLYLKVVEAIQDTKPHLPSDSKACLATTVWVGNRVLDLGTGNGILLLMLAKDFQDMYFTGIEIIKELCEIAVINFERMSEYLKIRSGDFQSPNCSGDFQSSDFRCLKYRILNADYAKPDDVLKDEQFDLIVSNPPYYPIGTGRMSKDSIKAAARFELTANLMQLLQCVKSYLKRDGKSFIIFPLKRSSEFVASCRQIGLAIKSSVYIDYHTKSLHKDLVTEDVGAISNRPKVNSKTKVIYEVVHA